MKIVEKIKFCPSTKLLFAFKNESRPPVITPLFHAHSITGKFEAYIDIAPISERNDFDVRAYFYPRWLLTITFPLAFTFMAIEFARFVFGPDLMHSGEAGIHE